jgi:hypothetical protein
MFIRFNKIGDPQQRFQRRQGVPPCRLNLSLCLTQEKEMKQSDIERRIIKLRKQQGSGRIVVYTSVLAGLLWTTLAFIDRDADIFTGMRFWVGGLFLALGVGWHRHYQTIKVFDAYLTQLQSSNNEKEKDITIN